MKKLIIILLVISAFAPRKASAQIDSASVKVNVSIQARDAEYLASFTPFREEYEDLFDSMKSKFRVSTPPVNTTNIAVDSVSVLAWLKVMAHIRKDHIAIQAGVFSRIEAVLRAKNNAYLTRNLNEANASDTGTYTEARLFGRIRLRKSVN